MCESCPEQFITKKALITHKKRTHAIGLPETLVCDRFVPNDTFSQFLESFIQNFAVHVF